MDYKNILIIKKKIGTKLNQYTYLGTKLKQKDICGDQIEIKTMTSNSDTDTWHYNATWH